MELVFKKQIDLATIADSGQCFRFKRISNEAFVTFIRDASVRVLQTSPVTISLLDSEDGTWDSYFNSDFHIPEDELFFHLESDPFLKSAYAFAPGMHLLQQDFWETIVSFIISQNNNIPKIKGSIFKVISSYGRFPSPEDILASPDKLEGCSLGYRVPYLVDAASKFDLLNELHSSEMYTLSHDDKLNELKRVKGIGDKVANCISLFSWKDYSACPIDIWMTRVLQRHYYNRVPSWMKSNYAGYFQQLVFYYKRNKLGG